MFQKEVWEPILQKHNTNLKDRLSEEDLLAGYDSLHSALFHNANNLKNAFFEALRKYVSSIEYEVWSNNIHYYYSLFREIYNAEIWIMDFIESLDKCKLQILKDFAYNRLISKNYLKIFDDLNFINRLRYVPYEVKGENIISPSKESRLIPYKIHDYSKVGSYELLRETERLTEDYNCNSNCSILIMEVDFIFNIMWNVIDGKEWEELLVEVKSNTYNYYFYNNLRKNPSRLIEFKSIKLAPIIFSIIMNIYVGNNISDLQLVDTIKIKEDLAEFYIEGMDDKSIDYLEGMMELYFELYNHNSDNARLKKRIRERVIRKLCETLSDTTISEDFLNKFQTYSNDNFEIFDLLIEICKSNTRQRSQIVNLIMEKYILYFSSSRFYSKFFNFKGLSNILYCICNLDGKSIEKKLLSINFINEFKKLENDNEFDWDMCIMLGNKLRFHLGLLCKFVEEYYDPNISNKIIKYILDTFKEIKGYSIKKYKPLSWESIVEDTFDFRSVNSIENSQLLTFHIMQVLKKMEIPYIKEYVAEIWNYCSFSEGVLLIQEFKNDIVFDINDLFPSNISDVSLGMAEKEANFLIKTGYAEETLKYINYLKDLAKKHSRLHIDNDNWALMEIQALLHIGNADEALLVFSKLNKKSIYGNIEGLIFYYKKDYKHAKFLYDRVIKSSDINLFTIVNYSAVLIMLEDYSAAIEWCEKYIEEYKNDYLLNANLACAYAKKDQIKALHYFSIASNLNPDYQPAQYGLLENIKNIINEIPYMLEKFEISKVREDISNELIISLQNSMKNILNLSIPELELRVVNDINKTIELLSETPVSLQNYKENNLSDIIKKMCKMSMDHYGLAIDREPPQGFSKVSSGEIDLFIYKTGEGYRNIATGENKEWSPEKYSSQLKQLFAYLRENGGFGFTIIFNKKTHLQTVEKRRKEILERFYIEDGNNKLFQKYGSMIDMGLIIKELKGALLTRHKNPEKENSYVRVYHFIINAYTPERKKAAKDRKY